MVIAENNRRIAKNTVYLYLRTILVLLVSLYVSRLVLNILGVKDLGLYNVVGGIVTLMSFIQAAQTKATSRFITYELGKNTNAVVRIFSVCVTIHIIMSVVVLIVAETVGLLIVNYFTEIPENRIIAANIAYQFSVFSFIFVFLRIPCDSVIIAHENMAIYAYMSILEVFLQFSMVMFLEYLSGDKLVLYSMLMFVISIILFFLFAVYVRNKYKQFVFRWIWDKQVSYQVMTYSGWSLLGNSTNTLTQQGLAWRR